MMSCNGILRSGFTIRNQGLSQTVLTNLLTRQTPITLNIQSLILASHYRYVSTLTEALSVLQINNSNKNNHVVPNQQSSPQLETKKVLLPLHEQLQSNKVIIEPPTTLSRMEIRLAYFQAAKESHPDCGITADDETAKSMNDKFNKVTQAYEYLIQHYCTHSNSNKNNTNSNSNDDNDNNWGITLEEEIDFNDSCLAVLGLRAEIVEESKQDPSFRQWLLGNTDSAYIWRNFLANHGGLAPKLRPRLMLDTSTEYTTTIENSKRQQRRRRRHHTVR
jgi:DnaJ domain